MNSMEMGQRRYRTREHSGSGVSDGGSFVGSLRDSVMNSMEMGQRRYRTREHSDSLHSLEEQRWRRTDVADMPEKSPGMGPSDAGWSHRAILTSPKPGSNASYRQGSDQEWDFKMVREVMTDTSATVLGEISYNGVSRQCWGV